MRWWLWQWRARRKARTWRRFAEQHAGRFRMATVAQAAAPWFSRHTYQVRTQRIYNRTPDLFLPQVELTVEEVPVTARVGYGQALGFRTYFEAEYVLGVGPTFDPMPHEVRGALIDSNGEVTSLVIPKFVTKLADLTRAVSAISTHARSDAFALRELRSLPDSTWIDSDDETGLPAVELALPERVIMGPRQDRPGRFTTMRTTVSRAMCFEARVGSDEVPLSVPPATLETLHGGLLRCSDGTLYFDWVEIQLSAGALIEAARALVAVARAVGGGVYR